MRSELLRWKTTSNIIHRVTVLNCFPGHVESICTLSNANFFHFPVMLDSWASPTWLLFIIRMSQQWTGFSMANKYYINEDPPPFYGWSPSIKAKCALKKAEHLPHTELELHSGLSEWGRWKDNLSFKHIHCINIWWPEMVFLSSMVTPWKILHILSSRMFHRCIYWML